MNLTRTVQARVTLPLTRPSNGPFQDYYRCFLPPFPVHFSLSLSHTRKHRTSFVPCPILLICPPCLRSCCETVIILCGLALHVHSNETLRNSQLVCIQVHFRNEQCLFPFWSFYLIVVLLRCHSAQGSIGYLFSVVPQSLSILAYALVHSPIIMLH